MQIEIGLKLYTQQHAKNPNNVMPRYYESGSPFRHTKHPQKGVIEALKWMTEYHG